MLNDSHRLTRHLTLALAALAFPFLTACGGDAVEDDVGLETDEVYETEVTEGAGLTTNYFSDWDSDTDSYLNEGEFESGWGQQDGWGNWDADDDSFLSEDEFNTAFANERWYNDSLYTGWNANNDEYLDENEFRTGLFDTWDADDDQRLAENEFDMGLFD